MQPVATASTLPSAQCHRGVGVSVALIFPTQVQEISEGNALGPQRWKGKTAVKDGSENRRLPPFSRSLPSSLSLWAPELCLAVRPHSPLW